MSSTETLVDLVRKYGTVRELNDFLRARGLPGGSTWSQLLDERVWPALDAGQLSEEALLSFLRDSEEYGRQHVFLYTRKVSGNPIPAQPQVEKWLETIGATDVLSKPAILDLPEHPRVAEVRRERLKNSDVFTIKVIERRSYDALLGTTELGDGRYMREYQREEVRAVNIFRVHANGLVEIRVHQHRSGSRDYREELSHLMRMTAELIDPRTLHPISLVRAKSNLYDERHKLEHAVSFTGTHILDSDGISYTAACGRQKSLFAHDRTEKSIAALTAGGEAYHDSLNVWWLAQDKGRPKQAIHVILGGESNEFAVSQQCSRGDYEHVLAEILRFNK